MSGRHKLGGGSGESILVSQLQHGLTLEFEHSDSPRRLRLVLSELLAIMNKVCVGSSGFPVNEVRSQRAVVGWADLLLLLFMFTSAVDVYICCCCVSVYPVLIHFTKV